MKMKTIEEKAKRYDEAIKRAKGVIEQNPLMEYLKKGIEYIFPELKESKDERMWILIKKYAHYNISDMALEADHITREQLETWLEKQGKQKQDPCDNCKDVRLNCHNFPCVKKKAFKQGKSVFDIIKEEKVDNANKLEPKFRVKYAGSEYNVFEIKNIAGVTFYGIEDEPNHIDYVKAENCERVDGYSIKENGSTYPTKSAVFSEQTTNDKVEPKFHEGDWLCENAPNNYARFIQILEIVNLQGKERYRISRDIHNDEDIVECRFIENNYHSFTIADVKAGDVLVYKENIKGSNGIKYERICLFNNFDNAFFILTTIFNDVEGYDIDVNINYPDDTIPATKEQRKQLEKAMVYAGYIFDFEKKELRKIEQKPTWSYEDEANLNNIIWLCNNCIKGSETTWIPSQATKIKHLIETIKEKGLVQQNPAWSEEDKKTLERVIRCIENHDYMNVDDIQWLKSIKDRCTWRPSDEQMKDFENFVRGIWESCYDSPYENNAKLLYSLLEQLKKLK